MDNVSYRFCPSPGGRGEGGGVGRGGGGEGVPQNTILVVSCIEEEK